MLTGPGQYTDYHRGAQPDFAHAGEQGAEHKLNTYHFGEEPADPITVGAYSTFAPSLLADSHLSRRGSSPLRQATLVQMQHTYGNRAVQRYIQRSTQATAGNTPVQRNHAAAPRTGRPQGGGNETWWQSLWKGVGNLLPKPDVNDKEALRKNERVKSWDSKGNIEYVHDEMPHCRMISDPHSRDGWEQICPDPWDWERAMYKERKVEPEVIYQRH